MALPAAIMQLATVNGTSTGAVVLVLIVAVPLLLLAWARTPSQTAGSKVRLPPSPPGSLPIIGHLHHIGPQAHTSLRDLVAKYGDNGLLYLRAGAVPTVVVSSPSGAEAVLRTHDHILSSRPWSMATDILRYKATDVGFAPLGEYWQKSRKLLYAHLLSSQKVFSFRHGRQEEVRLAINKIREACTNAPSTAVDMSEVMAAFTNDVVSRTVLGASHRKDGRNTLFREMTETNVDLLVGFNLENYIPRWPLTEVLFKLVCWRAQRHRNKWDVVLNEVINEHSTMKPASGGGDNKDPADFVTVLLSLQQEYGLTDDNVKAILMNVFEASIEAAYLVLEYTVAELINNRHVMKKLQTEVRTFATESSSDGKKPDTIREEDLSSLPYLKAAVKEAMRLHPPGPLLIPHYSTADCKIDGYDILANTRILVNGWAIGRDPKVWDNPEDFVPERFLQNGWEKSISWGQDFRYLPFGSGRRICPGANFALAMVEVMLANLMYHFDWEVPNEKQDAVAKVSMDETFGLMVRRNEKLYLVPRIVV